MSASDSDVGANPVVDNIVDTGLAPPRIHYAPYHRHEREWQWPADKSPVLACEYQPRQPPLYQRTAKRLLHSLREHTTALDDVTCRDCRRSEAFQEDHRRREDRNNATPRGWRYWDSKRKRRQTRATKGSYATQRYRAEQDRLAAIEAAKRPPVAMSRTRPAREQPPCTCPRHTKAHDKRVASLPPCNDGE